MRARFINKEDREKLRKSMKSRSWLPFRIALETGLRIGDIVSLERRNVCKHGGKPCIRYRAQKTGKRGYAPISDELYTVLAALPEGYLFPGKSKSGHITRQTAYARMKTAARRAGLDPDGVSPHSLRKVFAVDMRHEKGLEAVKEALQHSNEEVTRIYAYADTVLNAASDEPMRWRDLEMLVEYIIERMNEK